jgi:MraZ protein
VLIGEYQHNIDAKGRLIVPSKLRESLGETFIATRGFDKCVVVYPMDVWMDFLEKIKQLPASSSDARRFIRFFTSNAAECQIDGQGRILLPIQLREYAGLKKQIVSIGVGDRAEIWDRSTWDKYNSDMALDESFMDKLSELGI